MFDIIYVENEIGLMDAPSGVEGLQNVRVRGGRQ